jgi:uncharacterized membrane protein YphA (DoxX/SURF4 family)
MSGISTSCPAPALVSKCGNVWASVQFGRVCRWTLAGVFLLAAATKITDLPGFADRLVLHSGLPFEVARGVAGFLPWLELTCGFSLALNRAAREAATICCWLLILFLAHALVHLPESDCGCLVWPRSVPLLAPWPWLIVRNLLLLGCGLRAAGPPPSRPAGIQSFTTLSNGASDLPQGPG